MKINLRQAAMIQKIFEDEVSKQKDEDAHIIISLFENNICERLEQQSQAYLKAEANMLIYWEARRVLRAIIAEYNVKAGIHELLAEDAMLASKGQHFNNIMRFGNPRLSNEAIKRQNESLLNSDERFVKLSAIPQEFIDTVETQLEDLKRRRRKIKDELLLINVNTEITVPQKVALLIKELGLA